MDKKTKLVGLLRAASKAVPHVAKMSSDLNTMAYAIESANDEKFAKMVDHEALDLLLATEAGEVPPQFQKKEEKPAEEAPAVEASEEKAPAEEKPAEEAPAVEACNEPDPAVAEATAAYLAQASAYSKLASDVLANPDASWNDAAAAKIRAKLAKDVIGYEVKSDASGDRPDGVKDAALPKEQLPDGSKTLGTVKTQIPEETEAEVTPEQTPDDEVLLDSPIVEEAEKPVVTQAEKEASDEMDLGGTYNFAGIEMSSGSVEDISLTAAEESELGNLFS